MIFLEYIITFFENRRYVGHFHARGENTDIMHLLKSMRKLLAKFTSASMKNMTWMPSYLGDLPLLRHLPSSL